MYLKRQVHPHVIWYFSWQTLLMSGAISAAVVYAYQYSGLTTIGIPFLPVATIGTAVAFYVGFKNNSSYDRLWEARKIWGEITNLSRALAAYIVSVTDPRARALDSSATEVVRRQIAYVNMLRMQLRRRNVWDKSHPYTYLSAQCFPTQPFDSEARATLRDVCTGEIEVEELIARANPAKELLLQQMRSISQLHEAGTINSFQQSDLMRICTELFAQQGKAERIKSFPFPRQYAYFSEVFVRIFICLLPFALVHEFAKMGTDAAWLTIPFTMLIAWIFDTMEKVGDTSENPFENGLNDVPMTAICRTIEIDLKEMLRDAVVPAHLEPINNILM
jgi:putative membrane protein